MAEAFVARWFPQKHQVVVGFFALYVGSFGLYKFLAGNPKPVKASKAKAVAAPVATTAAVSQDGGFQGPTEATFDQWASKESNFKAWEQWLEKPGSLDQWAKSL